MSQARKISVLPEIVAPNAEDLLLGVRDPDGSPSTRQLTVGNLLGNSSATIRAAELVLARKETPANSAITVERGTVFFDDDFLYVATATNTLKRVALSSF